MIHLKWIKSRKVRNIKNSLPLIISKVDITYITSHNVYYVNSKVGEVMEKKCLDEDIESLRDAIFTLDTLIHVNDDDELLDVMFHARSELKILVYDLEEFVQCD